MKERTKEILNQGSSISPDKGKPTNWEYISALVDYIK